MYQLLNFLNRFRNLIVFIVLESIALVITLNFYHYQRHIFFNNIGHISNAINNKKEALNSYFFLNEKNEQLFLENKNLRKEINKLQLSKKRNPELFEKDILPSHYGYKIVKIINNDTKGKYNFITINKGRNDSIEKEQGLINEKGILGIVFQVSNHYGLALSILNLNTKINARLKNNAFYGTILWNGENPNILQLEDIERQAPLKIGDTVVTGGRSTIFPDGIPIGTVLDITSTNKSFEKIDILPFNDMNALEFGMIIQNNHKKEIKQLETETSDE